MNTLQRGTGRQYLSRVVSPTSEMRFTSRPGKAGGRYLMNDNGGDHPSGPAAQAQRDHQDVEVRAGAACVRA